MPMIRRAVLLLLLGCCAGPLSADAVDDYVAAAMKEQKIPGLALAIVRDGQPARMQGYGLANVELQVPVSADTIFQSGSVGKQFTAAGVLLLVEDGKLGLDDPLSKHFPGGPSAWHRIRVRHLLGHTSGLKDYGDEEFDLRRDYTEEQLLEVMKKVPLEFEPGTQWSYSNSGYVVLGLLTSKLAGKHWSEFLTERVFAPLGMTTTRMISEAAIVPNRADGYQLAKDGTLQNQDWVSPTANSLGDGALYFTVKDLVAWETGLRARRLLNAVHYDAWWTPVALTPGVTHPYGFGWAIGEQRGRRMIEHGGSWQGFRAAIARYVEDGLTVVVLANVASARPETIAKAIAGLVDADLRLPDAAKPRAEASPARAEKLRGVLAAFADSRPNPDLGHGLAATASGSVREAYQRRAVGEQLASLKSFAWLDDDDLAARPLERRGERVTRIAHYVLESKAGRRVFRFHLTEDGRVADFDSEPR
ncbi:MAG: beta-lactamase family protein [Vicinamibacteria bacterium]|nr:beta-lactamase family protein [Vicinamibacteria bacterium]